jgi:membrane glycosyltransferase
MVLLHPKTWLVLGLVGYGVYYLVSGGLSATTMLFCWGVAAGTTALIAFALLVQSRRKRMASINGNTKPHVA